MDAGGTMRLRNAAWPGVFASRSGRRAGRTREPPSPAAADPVYSAAEADCCTGGNHDDAARRFRTNQSTHWRQVAIRGH